MDMNKFLNYSLFQIGEFDFKISIFVHILALLVGVVFLLGLLKQLINRNKRIEVGKKFAIKKLLQYIIVTFSFFIALNILGFDITVFWATSAALFVGLGFGLQHLFSDFISGIILLLDGTLKVNDIIEVNGMICSVEDINFRTTTVIGRHDNYVIVPNSELTGSKVVNWTYSKVSSRFSVQVGVDYASDIHLVMKIMNELAVAHKHVIETPAPFVRFEDYADSALIFKVYFYSNEVFRVENIKSDLRIAIFEAFKTHKIGIPFPQRVLHMPAKTEAKPE